MWLLALILLTTLDAQGPKEIQAQIAALESPTSRERDQAQLLLFRNLQLEHRELILAAVQSQKPESEVRLAELLANRPDWVPVLIDWLVASGPESAFAKRVLEWSYLKSQPKPDRESEVTNLDLEPIPRTWTSISDAGISWLDFIDTLNRFGKSDKPVLLDPQEIAIWESWKGDLKNVQDSADQIFRRILDQHRLEKEARPQVLNSFVWISSSREVMRDEQVFIRLLKAWRSELPALRRMAAIDLGLLDFSPVHSVFAREFAEGGPRWREALTGVLSARGVWPEFFSREGMNQLLDALSKDSGCDREIGYALWKIGPKQLDGNSWESEYAGAYARARPGGKKILQQIAMRFGFTFAQEDLKKDFERGGDSRCFALRQLEHLPEAELKAQFGSCFQLESWDRCVVEFLNRAIPRIQEGAQFRDKLFQIYSSHEDGRRQAALEVITHLHDSQSLAWIQSQVVQMEDETIWIRAAESFEDQVLRGEDAARFRVLEQACASEKDLNRKLYLGALLASSQVPISEDLSDSLIDLLFAELEHIDSKIPSLTTRSFASFPDALVRERLCVLVLDASKAGESRIRALQALRYQFRALPNQDRPRSLGSLRVRLAGLKKENSAVAVYLDQLLDSPPVWPPLRENLLDQAFLAASN